MNAKYMPIKDVLAFVQSRLGNEPPKIRKNDRHDSSPSPTGAVAAKNGAIVSSKARTSGKQPPKTSLAHDLVRFWSGVDCEPDTLNRYILLTARVLQYEVDEEAAIQLLERYCQEHPNPSFSDRLTEGKYSEVRRVIRQTVENVYRDNGGQPDPERSTRILDGVHASFVRRGFKISDKSTWRNLGNTRRTLGPSFLWSADEIRLIRDHLVPVLKTDLTTAKAATKHFLRFVEGHFGQGIARDSIPELLNEFPIRWGKRSKRTQFIKELLSLGWLYIRKRHVWCERDSKGKARVYGVGSVIRHKWQDHHPHS